MAKVSSSSTPAYLSDLIQTAVPVRPLSSSDAPQLNVPKLMTYSFKIKWVFAFNNKFTRNYKWAVTRTRTDLTRRFFSVAAATAWNSLPSNIGACRTLPTFKRHLKTYLFRQSRGHQCLPPHPRTSWRNVVLLARTASRCRRAYILPLWFFLTFFFLSTPNLWGHWTDFN